MDASTQTDLSFSSIYSVFKINNEDYKLVRCYYQIHKYEETCGQGYSSTIIFDKIKTKEEAVQILKKSNKDYYIVEKQY